MKKIRITETELVNIIKKVYEQIEPSDEDDFTVEPHIKMIPREKQIQGMFGKYEEQIPNDVLRYMRKNPQLIMNRLVNIYGDKFLDFAEKAYENQIKNTKY